MIKVYTFVTVCLLWVNAQAWGTGGSGQSINHTIYVQTDKEFYLTGEIIWFRVFLLSVQGMHGAGCDMAYIDVVNDKGMPVMQARIETGVSVSNGGSFWIANELPTGIYRLYGYTDALKSDGEDAFFQKEIMIFNPFLPVGQANASRTAISTTLPNTEGKLHIDIGFSESSMEMRENGTFTVVTSIAGEPTPADMAVSIVKVDALQSQHRLGIADHVKNAELARTGVTEDSRQYIDSLNGKQMVGVTFLDGTGNKPLVGQDVFISFPGLHFELYPARTDASGTAHFYTDRLRGNLMLSTGLRSGDRSVVELQSPHWQRYRPVDSKQFPNISTEKLLDRSIQVQAENLYRLDERSQFSGIDRDTIPFYGKADVTYRLDDYTRFPTMEEVLREYVTEVRVYRHQQQFNLRVLDRNTRYFYSGRPLLLFNGLPVIDVSAVMAFDPERFEQIDIIASQYYFGGNLYDGVVNFRTYDGSLVDFAVDASVTLLDYEGIQVDRKFFTPDYSSVDGVRSRLPDMRNVLYWTPRLLTDAAGKAEIQFSTSEIAGTYLISVDAIDNEGNVGSQRIMFTVK